MPLSTNINPSIASLSWLQEERVSMPGNVGADYVVMSYRLFEHKNYLIRLRSLVLQE